MSSLTRIALPAAVLAALTACGGGGGSAIPDATSAAPPPVVAPPPAVSGVNVAAAWKDYTSTPHSWTMQGKGADARAYELTVALKPGTAGAFALTGASGQTTEQTLRFAIAGANTVSTVGTLYFTADNMLGVAGTDGACAGARAAMAALPASSAVGTSGDMFVLDGYAGCKTTGQNLGSTTFGWSVEKDGDVVMFCMTSKQQDATGAATTTETDCMEASPAGALGNRAKFTITKPDGSSISGRNF